MSISPGITTQQNSCVATVSSSAIFSRPKVRNTIFPFERACEIGSLATVSNDPRTELIEPDEMGWETAAREAIESAAATIETDEPRGVLYMTVGEDQRFNRIPIEFTGWEEVRHTLTEIGESEWINYVPFDGGEPVFGPDVSSWVESAMVNYRIEEFFDKIARPDEGEELVNSHDLLEHRAGLVARLDVEEINAQLVRRLALHPEMMYELDPRKFEQLVAELFRDKGYDIELGRGTKDGGIDMRAFLRNDIGTLLTLIQCKRFAPQNKVNVDVIRGLYGVVNREDASSGLIVTTSSFTRDTRSEQSEIRHRIHLAEYTNLVDWLRQYPRRAFATKAR